MAYISNLFMIIKYFQFPGIEKRIYAELSALLPESNIRVRALPNRELLGWIGGARWEGGGASQTGSS